MNEFFIKYSDGKTDTADAEIASGNITSLKFPSKYEFDKIEYVVRMPYTPEIKVIIWFKRATQDAKAVISASVFIKNAKMANL